MSARYCGCGYALPPGLPEIMCPFCRLDGALQEDHEPLLLEERVLGSYRLLEELGRGGMGVVYRAQRLEGGAHVALKTIAAGELATPETLRRFRREAHAAAEVQHPHLVAIHEAGEFEGTPFLVMTLIEGRTLDARLKEGPLPPRDAAEMARTIALAVSCIHAHGILHRDLKPSNVLLDAAGRPFVSDFGLARIVHESLHASSLTRSGQVLGSPAWMAPEQARGEGRRLGPEADVYALGAILYHMLAGRPPFEAANLYDLLDKLEKTDPAPLRPEVPRDLKTICLACLEKSPAVRCRTALDLADDLGRWLEGTTIRARRPPFWRRPVRWAQRRPVVAALTALTMVCAIVAAVMVIVARGHSREADRARTQTALDEARNAAGSFDPARRSRGMAAVQRVAASGWTDELRDLAVALQTARSFEPDGASALLPQGAQTPTVSANFKELAYALEGSIHLLRTDTGEETMRFDEAATRQAGDGAPAMLEFSSTGRLLAAQSANGLLRVWNIDSRNAKRDPGAPPPQPVERGRWQTTASVAAGFHPVLPAGDRFVALRLPPGAPYPKGALVLSDTNGKPARVIQEGTQAADFIMWNPKKDTCAIFSGGKITFNDYRADGSTNVLNVLTPPARITRAAWQANGQRIMTGAVNGDTGFFSAFSDFKYQLPSLRHNAAITNIALAEDLTTFTVSSDGLSRISRHDQVFLQTTEWTGIAFNHNGERLAMIDRTGCVQLFRQVEPVGVRRIAGTVGATFEWWDIDVAESTDTLLMDSERFVQARTTEGEPPAFLSARWDARIRGASFTPDESAIVTMDDRGFVMFALKAIPHTPPPPRTGGRESGALTPNLAPAPNGPERIRVETNPSWLPRRFCFGKDGTLAFESIDGRYGVARWPDLQNVRELAGRRASAAPGQGGSFGSAGALAVSPDGAWVAGGFPESGPAVVWDARTGTVVKDLPHAGAVHFSPDGHWLLLGGDDAWRLYAAATWQEKWVLPRNAPGHQRGVAAFSPDGARLVLDIAPFSLRLIETAGAGTLVNLPFPAPLGATSVRFHHGLIYAGTRGNTVFRWDLAALREALRGLGTKAEF